MGACSRFPHPTCLTCWPGAQAGSALVELCYAVLCCVVLGLRFLPQLPHFEECSHQQQPWWCVHVPAAGAESASILEVEL